MNNEEIKKELIELLKDEDNIIVLNNNVNNSTSSLWDIHDNNEDFFNDYYYENTLKAVRAVCYGDYRYTDDYVIINNSANLESSNSYMNFIELDDLAEAIIESWDSLDFRNNELGDYPKIVGLYLRG